MMCELLSFDILFSESLRRGFGPSRETEALFEAGDINGIVLFADFGPDLVQEFHKRSVI